MSVAGLLLAAGAGSRMGRPKALVELDGELLVERGIRLLAAGGCDPVVVVLGAEAEQVRRHCTGATVVVAAGWETGLGASLRAGLGALDADACVVALVDQPLVTAEAVRRLVGSDAIAAVATYQGHPRNPVRLDRAVWADVAAAATGDGGARSWLRAHPALVVQVDCSDAGSPDDLDTPQDLAALTQKVDL